MTEVNVPQTNGAITEDGIEITWDQAEAYNLYDSKFFKPEPNTEYKLTFSEAKLLRKLVQDYNDVNKKIEATVLELKVSSINSQPIQNQLWNVRSFKLRAMFEPYAELHVLTQKTFIYKFRGQGRDVQYTLAAVD